MTAEQTVKESADLLRVEHLAHEVREWRRDVFSMPDDGRRVAVLVYAYNWSTNPRTFHTDREHRTRRRFARWIKNRLARHRGWFENDSGRLVTAAPAQGWDRIPGNWNGR